MAERKVSLSYDLYSEYNQPSIMVGYGPHTIDNLNGFGQVISTIYNLYNSLGGNPPLGFKFGIISNGKFTEYVYESGSFATDNVGIGIVPVGSGSSSTTGGVSDVKVNNTSVVTNGVANITTANTLGSYKNILDNFILIEEDGIYNIDENFLVEPSSGGVYVSGGGGNSDLESRVAAIETVLGDLLTSNATFNVNN